MAIITATINIQDANEANIRRDMAAAMGYTDTVDDGNGNQIPNPVTKAKFNQQKYNEHFREWFRNTLKSYRTNEALKVVVEEEVNTPVV